MLETLHAVALVFSTQGAPAAYTHPPSVAQSPATPVPAPGNICVISRPKSRGNYTGFGLHIYCPEKVPPVQATLAAQSLLSLASVPVHVATPSLAPVQLEPQASNLSRKRPRNHKEKRIACVLTSPAQWFCKHKQSLKIAPKIASDGRLLGALTQCRCTL